jgi:hypothetical protein
MIMRFIVTFVFLALLPACGPKDVQPASPAGTPAEPAAENTGGDEAPAAESEDFSTPAGTVEVFILACIAKDADLLSRCFSENAEGEFKPIVVKTASDEDLEELKAMFEGASVGETTMSPDGATASVKVNLAEGDEKIKLAREGDVWKIIGF